MGKSVLIRFAALSVILGGLGIAACKENPPEKKPAKQGTGDQTQSPTFPASPPAPAPAPSPSDGKDDDDDDGGKSGSKSGGKKDDCKKTDDGEGLGLTATKLTYVDDIKSIIQDKCNTCHDPNEKDKDPDLTTYTKLKKAASKVAKQVADGDMPPSGSDKLTKSEKDKIVQWIEDGALEKKPSSSGDDCKDDDDDDGKDGKDAKDGKDDDDDDDNTSAWEDLINPAKLQECKKDEKIFDRKAEKCHRAKIAESYECKRASIIEKFGKLSVNVTSQMDQMDKDGYVIDQCGEYNDEPIVYFYKKSETSGSGELSLLIRKICKKDSAACDNP